MKDLLFVILVMFIAVFGLPLTIMYGKQYHYDASKQTATNGIMFHTTIEMKNYEQLGTATNLFCPYGADLYTRSLKHETFTVCKRGF